MNKRQKKKQFKKKYGFNPPTVKNVDSWASQISDILTNFCCEIRKMVSNTFDAMKTIIRKIQEMSDNEFDEFFEKLDSEQKRLAWKIRFGGTYEGSNEIPR